MAQLAETAKTLGYLAIAGCIGLGVMNCSLVGEVGCDPLYDSWCEEPVVISSMSYGGQTYRTAKIGSQTWMAENLNYKAPGSKCFGEGGTSIIYDEGIGYDVERTLSDAEVQANCERYGRLYDWSTALTVCPSGWHLPSNDDWHELLRYVDRKNGGNGIEFEDYYYSYTASRYLKATTGWKEIRVVDINGNSGVRYNNGIDKYDFSALPGGSGYVDFFSDGSLHYSDVGDFGYWWSTTNGSRSIADGRVMAYRGESVDWFDNDDESSGLLSVRCLQD